MRLLDTNIFVYAHGRPHPLSEPCRALVGRLGEDTQGYTIDTELLQEILHVYSVRDDLVTGFAIFDQLIELFPDPAPVTGAEMQKARRLLEQYPALSPRDAIHAAVVQTQGLEGIVTTDRVFQQVRDLRVFDPRKLTRDATPEA